MLTDKQIADAARRFAEAIVKAESATAKWPAFRRVERLEDMSQRGLLRLVIQDDGDIIVAVQSFENGLLQPGASVEFCIPGTGGGRSPRTHAALRALMEAMALDNQEEPGRSPEPGRG